MLVSVNRNNPGHSVMWFEGIKRAADVPEGWTGSEVTAALVKLQPLTAARRLISDSFRDFREPSNEPALCCERGFLSDEFNSPPQY